MKPIQQFINLLGTLPLLRDFDKPFTEKLIQRRFSRARRLSRLSDKVFVCAESNIFHSTIKMHTKAV